MTRRTGRGVINTKAVLLSLKEGRSGAIRVCREAKINSPEYKAAQAVTEAIDDLAEKLTGNREFFWTVPHGAGQ